MNLDISNLVRRWIVANNS